MSEEAAGTGGLAAGGLVGVIVSMPGFGHLSKSWVMEYNGKPSSHNHNELNSNSELAIQ